MAEIFLMIPFRFISVRKDSYSTVDTNFVRHSGYQPDVTNTYQLLI